MGIATLRRYHARPDNGIEQGAKVSTPDDEPAEVVAAREAWEKVSAEASDAIAAIEQFQADHGSQLVTVDAEGNETEEPSETVFSVDELDDDERAEYEDLATAAKNAQDVQDAARSAWDSAIIEAQKGREAPVLPEAPKRSASGQIWKDWALSHGKTEADIEGLGRDAIAEMFLGPKA